MRRLNSHDILKAYRALYDYQKFNWLMATGRMEKEYEILELIRVRTLSEFHLSNAHVLAYSEEYMEYEKKFYLRKTAVKIAEEIYKRVESCPCGKNWKR